MHSHPQALGQCAGFLREQLPGAAIGRRALDRGRGARGGRATRRRTARTRRSGRGTRRALYGAVVLAEDLEDDAEQRDALRVDRARRRRRRRRAERGRRKTLARLLGRRRPRPGLARRAAWRSSPSRGVNLTRIESRPRRRRARPLHVLLRPRGRARPSRTVADAIAGTARALRGGSGPRVASRARRTDAAADAVYTPASMATAVPPGPVGSVPLADHRRHGPTADGARPLVGWSCAGAQRDVRADQRLHGAARDGAAAQGEGRGDRDRAARPALGARLDAEAGRDPARAPTCGSRATRTSARSPAARCSPATAGRASTAARARA